MLESSHLLPCAAGGLAICAASALDSKIQKSATSSSSDTYSLLNLDSYSGWRLSLMAGYMFASTLFWSLFGSNKIDSLGVRLFENQEEFLSGISSFGFLISGFLVGFGAKLTDGGVSKFAFYGIPSGSRRSLIGLVLILGVAAIIAGLKSYHPFFDEEDLEDFAKGFNPILALFAPVLLLGISIFKTQTKLRDTIVSFGIGSLFSIGVMFSGLAQRHKVIHSLTLNKSWDPFLLSVFALIAIFNVLLFRFLHRYKDIEKQSLSSKMDSKFVLGCCFLGAGLGISGLTPGSALLVTPLYLPQIGLFFLPFVALGQFCAEPMGEWMIKELHIGSKGSEKKD